MNKADINVVLDKYGILNEQKLKKPLYIWLKDKSGIKAVLKTKSIVFFGEYVVLRDEKTNTVKKIGIRRIHKISDKRE